jgi:hypothetical protein
MFVLILMEVCRLLSFYIREHRVSVALAIEVMSLYRQRQTRPPRPSVECTPMPRQPAGSGHRRAASAGRQRSVER